VIVAIHNERLNRRGAVAQRSFIFRLLEIPKIEALILQAFQANIVPEGA
jgi:hypothetical protein